MKRNPQMLVAISLAGISVGLLAGAALAGHTEPGKAKKATFGLVNSYVPPTGSGKMTLQVIGSLAEGTQDIKLTAVANGLNEFCENDQLCMRLSFRATTDDCPEGSCTTFDVENEILGGACCLVTGGKCKIETTLSAAFPGLLANAKNTGIELHGCGLKGSAAFLLPPEISCGLLLK